MANLLHLKVDCRRILCEHAKRRQPITYGELAKALGLALARQKWSVVLDPLAVEERKISNHDLTQIVIYGKGHRLAGLSRYFSPKAPRTVRMDPSDEEQVRAYKHEREAIFDAYAKLPC